MIDSKRFVIGCLMVVASLSGCSAQEDIHEKSIQEAREAILEMPAADEKLVIAHNMVTPIPGINRGITVDTFRPDGKYADIGGLNLVLPLDARSESELSNEPVPFRLELGLCDGLLEREMLAAKELGIDGFQFYFPCLGPENKSWQNEVETFVGIICRYFKVAEERDIDFKLTLCISHPRIKPGAEKKADVLARQIKMVLDKVGDSPKWLRTPDGRLLFFTFAPETLAESISHPSEMFDDPARLEEHMAQVAQAYNRLSEQLDVPEGVAYLFHLREWYYMDFIYRRNLQPVGFEQYEKYVNLVLDAFPAVYGWIDVDTPVNDLSWEYVIDLCEQRDRTYIQYIFNEISMSKVWSRTGNGRVTDPDKLTAPDDLQRFYVGTGLSDTWRKLLDRAVDNDVPMIALTSWNDYEEGHHMAPEVNHNFGFSVLLNHYKRLWRGEAPLVGKEQAAVFFKKHSSEAKGSLFDVPVARMTWVVSQDDWERLLKADDKIQVVTLLKGPAEVWFRGEHVGDVQAGMDVLDLPLTPGPVEVEIRRDGQSVLEVVPPEWVTDDPYRTDRMTYTWSSDHEDILKRIYGDYPTATLSEYAEIDGVPNWERLYSLGVDYGTDEKELAGDE